jgi:ankyrin repeat protein
VSVATARRGMDFDLLTDCIPQDGQRDQVSLPHIKDYCRSITSKLLIEDTIPPLEPDILGETYFLLFLKSLKDGYSAVLPLRSHFISMLSCGEAQLQTTDALQFIGFITRLTRNLCNDNQEDEIVKEHWKTLLDFLRPEKFPYESTMRWAVSAALVEIVDMLKKNRKEYYDRVLSQIDADALYTQHHAALIRKATFCAMRYFEEVCGESQTIPQSLQKLFKCFGEQNQDGATALMVASANGHEKIVLSLLKTKLDINAQDKRGGTALMVASSACHTEIVQLLLKNEADPNIQNYKGTTALVLASENEDESALHVLLEYGADVNVANFYGFTPLMRAIMWGYDSLVPLLLQHGVDVNMQNCYGTTALIAAARHDNGMVETLIEHDANVNAQANDGTTALMNACQNGHEKMVHLLIAEKADVNAKNINGCTALMFAVWKGYATVVHTLLVNKADVNLKTDTGYTALMWASNEGHESIVQMLISENADANVYDIKRKTALDYAREAGHINIVNMLIAAGAKEQFLMETD